MSKMLKSVISIVIAVVVIGAVGAGGFIAGREWTLRTLTRTPRSTTQLQNGLPNPNENSGQNQVRNNLHPRGAFRLFFKPDQRRFLRHGFQPERGRPFGLFFAPFFLIGGLIGGLISLAFLALLVSLTVFIYRRWQPRAAPVNVSLTPTATSASPETDEALNEGKS